MTSETTYWNDYAASFDDEPDHGLRDPTVAAAWDRLLRQALPRTPGRVADLGCGTGSLAYLMAAQGHDVTGIDFASEMVERARAKVPAARFEVGDAARPGLPAASFDAVVVRHVLWALPDTEAALDQWIELLTDCTLTELLASRASAPRGGSPTALPAAPTALLAARRKRLPGSERLPGKRSPAAGRLVLIEGRWHTGGGIPAATLLPLVQARLGSVGFRLLPDADLWGGEITDERYLIVAR